MRVEEGDIRFLTVPAHRHGETDFEETDHFFMVLSPNERKHRLIELGRKRVPEIETRLASASRHSLGVVEKVAADPAEIPQTLADKFAGEPDAVAYGKYLIEDHDGHSDFAYTASLFDVDEARHLGIEEAGTFIMAIKNPDAEWPRGFPVPTGKPDWPAGLQGLFNGADYLKVKDQRLLDHEQTPLALVAPIPRLARAELNVAVNEDREAAAAARHLTYLHQKQVDHPTEPLV